MNRRLYRSPDDRVVAGVAGGMAENYDMDPSLVRIVWALLILFTGGVFLILYIIMALVVPLREPYGPAGEGTETAGTAAVGDETEPGFGSGAAAGTTGPASYRPGPPPRRAHGSDNSGPLIFGTLLVIVGVLFLLRQFINIDIGRLWPLAVILLGLLLIVTAFGRRERSA